jgi:hypothetical protein
MRTVKIALFVDHQIYTTDNSSATTARGRCGSVTEMSYTPAKLEAGKPVHGDDRLRTIRHHRGDRFDKHRTLRSGKSPSPAISRQVCLFLRVALWMS